jgi:uncharacterized protein DUF4834
MMPLSEIFALGLLAYLLYRLIFNFFVPIFKTTKQVRQQFRNMRDAMNGQQPGDSQNTSGRQGAHRQNGSATGPSATKTSATKSSSGKPDPHPSFDSIGEYIDFEEVKK